MLKSRRYLIFTIILMLIIAFLAVSNYRNKNKYEEENSEVLITEEFVFEPIGKEYDSNKKYYKAIDYTKFKQYFKGDKLRTIAVIDNSSTTYNKFLETINKIVFYKNTNIYLLETSKLSRMNLIDFYEIDDRFGDLSSNYIITVQDNKILSLTIFQNEDLNLIEEGIGE